MKDQEIIIEQAPDFVGALHYGAPPTLDAQVSESQPQQTKSSPTTGGAAVTTLTVPLTPAQERVADVLDMVLDNDPTTDDGRVDIAKKLKELVDSGDITDNNQNLLDLHAISLDYLDARDESTYSGVAFIAAVAMLITSSGLMAAKAGPAWLRSVWTWGLLLPVTGALGGLLWHKHNRVKDLENQMDTQISLIQAKNDALNGDIKAQADAMRDGTAPTADQPAPGALPVTTTPPDEPKTVNIDGKETPIGGTTMEMTDEQLAASYGIKTDNKTKAVALLDRFIWPASLSGEQISQIKGFIDLTPKDKPDFWTTGESLGSNWIVPLLTQMYNNQNNALNANLTKFVDGLSKSNGKYSLTLRPGSDGVMRVDLTAFAKLVNSNRG